MSRRAGYTLAEALVALLLLALLVQVAWTVTAVHAAGAFRVVAGSRTLETARITGWVLRGELRAGTPGVDWWSGPDTVGLRAFRRVGAVCPDHSEAGGLVVRSAGIREADPDKDSLKVLWPDGRWRVHELTRVSAAEGCERTFGDTGQRWAVGAPEAGGLLVRIFERGSYHVTDGAFRYRRGGSGRQPLTARSLAPSSSWEALAGGGLLVLEPILPTGPAWRSEQAIWSAGWRP